MISEFLSSLKHTPPGDLFNPWFEHDPDHDASAEAPQIRRLQLEQYLADRQNSAKYLMIAEALGYQGGHFTGIAMTSERILLGHQADKYGVDADHVFKSTDPRRTSRTSVAEKGMTEPTATIMWGALIELGIDPFDVVLWNAVPWHPYIKEKGLLSNRTPVDAELDAGFRHLKTVIGIFENAELVAVGRKCESSLSHLDVPFTAVRHPANGGAPKFRRQLKDIMYGR